MSEFGRLWKTLKYRACTVGWVNIKIQSMHCRLGRATLSQLAFSRESTQISHGRNSNGQYNLEKKKILSSSTSNTQCNFSKYFVYVVCMYKTLHKIKRHKTNITHSFLHQSSQTLSDKILDIFQTGLKNFHAKIKPILDLKLQCMVSSDLFQSVSSINVCLTFFFPLELCSLLDSENSILFLKLRET